MPEDRGGCGVWCELATERRGGGDDAVNDVVEEVEDVVLLDAEDVPSELSEEVVPLSVEPLAAFVVAAIHLNDEADLGASEVHDAGADDELATESEAGLGAGEAAPKALFGAGG